MHLLSSEMVSVDAALDRAIVWSVDLDHAVAWACADLEELESLASDDLEELARGERAAWYWPSLSALRSLIVGS